MAEETVKTYWAKFGLDSTNFINGITSAQKEFLAFTAGVTASVAVFTLAFNEYSRLVEKYGQMANELQDLSYATGASTEEIQRFHYAAKLSGDDIGMVDAMLAKLTLSMGQFADKSSPAAKAFQQLKVDPTGKSTSQVFEEIAKAMDNIPDAGTRASIGIDILGKSYRDSLPYMKDYLQNQEKIKTAMTFSQADQENASRAREGWASFWYSVDVFTGKTLFGAPEANKEAIDSTIALWREQYHYSEEQIKKSLVSNYGLDALQKLGYYTEAAASKPSRIDFENQFKGLNSTNLELAQLNIKLGEYNDQMEAARQSGNQKDFEKAAIGYRSTQLSIDAANQSLRDQNIQYQEIIDIQLPRLKENLDKAKATGLKSDIEASDIALKQGVNTANDLGAALGKAAISADNIKSSITPAAGWSNKSVIGSAGSEMATFMLDEMNHGATYEVALAAYNAGTHSYSAFTGIYAEGTLGAAANGGTSTRNPGKNEREAAAAAGKTSSDVKGTSVPGTSEQTADVKKEYSTQASSLKDLTTTVKDEYKKQADIFTEHLNALMILRTKAYPLIEAIDLIHFATYEETAKVAYQQVLDWMALSVNFAGMNPVIQNIVMVSSNGPDWTPPTFTPISAPKLTSADFTQVGAAVQAIASAGLGKGTSKDVHITTNITQNINSSDKDVADKTKDATTEGVSKGLASAEYLGGALI
jgi:hypothetical protein